MAEILIVDDDEGLLLLIGNALAAEGHKIATARSGREASRLLAARAPDLMLLDLKMQDGDGNALLDQLQRGAVRVPFIVVTGQGDEKVAAEVMKRGAQDYVMKNTALLDLLPGIVRRTLGNLAREHALAAAESERQRLERSVLVAGENERRRIGADLHDGLGQQLTAIELMCAGLKADAADPATARKLDEVGQLLRAAISQTRLLARGLYLARSLAPGGSSDSLPASLIELAKISTELGVMCRFTGPHRVEIADPAVTSHLYRIAQEATNNAIKHARASEVTIRLSRPGRGLVLEVSDNGKGLGKRDPAGSPGLGLEVMRSRAAAIGATLSIKSARGKGVAVVCRVPPPR